MNESFWKRNSGRLATGIVGIVIVLLVCMWESTYMEHDLKTWMRMVSDGCFTAAVLVGGVGLLVFISASFGGFDHITYLFHVMFDKLSPSEKRMKKRISYWEYVTERREKNAGKKLGSGVLTGGIFFLSAVVFAILYNVI